MGRVARQMMAVSPECGMATIYFPDMLYLIVTKNI
jgi:hypothetical protein